MLTAPALCPEPLLLNYLGSPDVRNQGPGDLPAQMTLMTWSHRQDSGRPGYELWQFQLREYNLSKHKEKRAQTQSRLLKRQDFTLFLSVILHPDSFQLQPSQTSLRSETAAFSKATRSNFLKMQQAFCPLSVVWLPLGPPLFLKRFTSAHLELCGALQGKEYVYSKCKNKYLPEFICSSRAGRLFKRKQQQ